MIANVLSLNEMTKKYRLTFNLGYENNFRVHIGDKIVKFSANYDGLYISKRDQIFFCKLDEEKKRNIIEWLNNFKPWGKTRRVLAKSSTKEHSRKEMSITWQERQMFAI